MRKSRNNSLLDSMHYPMRRHSLTRGEDYLYESVRSDCDEESECAGEPLSELEFEDAVIPEEEKSTTAFYFVEAGWFQAMVAAVIFLNVLLIFVEVQYPETKDMLYAPEVATLCFYIFELLCRINHFRYHFFGGPWRFVAWSILDTTVVSAGVLEFVLPFMPSEDIKSTLEGPLQVLVVLRILRVLKIVRIFLDSDLSWAESAPFQSFIGGVIVINAILMGLETDFEWGGWFFIEQALLVVYSFELLVRLKRRGLMFFSCYNPDAGWNWLDSAIVGSSAADSWVMPLLQLVLKEANLAKTASHHQHEPSGGMNLSQAMMLMRMLRLMRILRLVKLVKTVEPLYILVTGVAAAVQGVTWVLVLTIVILYAISILSTRLIGHGMVFPDKDHLPEGVIVFKSVPDSMFTLFRVMSGAQSDEEAQMIDTLMVAMPTIKFAFVFFMVTSSWTLLSILTAVVSENMIKTCGEQTEELQMISHEDDRRRHRADLETLFESMDYNTNGELEYHELDEILQSKEMAAQVAKLVRVPVRNVREVFKTLSRHGNSVHKDMFVECMLEVAKPVTEQSVMKIQAQILDTGNKHSDTLSALDNKIVKELERWSTVLERIEQSSAHADDFRGRVAELCKRQETSMACSIKMVERLGKLEAGIESLRHQLLSARAPGHNGLSNGSQLYTNEILTNRSSQHDQDHDKLLPFSASPCDLDSMVERLRERVECRSAQEHAHEAKSLIEQACGLAQKAALEIQTDLLLRSGQELEADCFKHEEIQTDLLLRSGQELEADCFKHEETQTENVLRHAEKENARFLKDEDPVAKDSLMHMGANVDRVCLAVDALSQTYKQDHDRNGKLAKIDAMDANVDRICSAIEALSQQARSPASTWDSHCTASLGNSPSHVKTL